jgi:hypothetical protein
MHPNFQNRAHIHFGQSTRSSKTMTNQNIDDFIRPSSYTRRASKQPATFGTYAMLVEYDANGQCGLVYTAEKKLNMIALNSPSLTQYPAPPQHQYPAAPQHKQQTSIYLPATKALEYKMGTEDKLVAMSDSSPVLPLLLHKTMINSRSRHADENSPSQAAICLSLTAPKRVDDDDASRYNLNNISQAVLDLVVGLEEDFPLIEWNNEEADKCMPTLSQSSFRSLRDVASHSPPPVLSPASFGHDAYNYPHRLLRSKSFGSELVALETLQTPIS